MDTTSSPTSLNQSRGESADSLFSILPRDLEGETRCYDIVRAEKHTDGGYSLFLAGQRYPLVVNTREKHEELRAALGVDTKTELILNELAGKRICLSPESSPDGRSVIRIQAFVAAQEGCAVILFVGFTLGVLLSLTQIAS